MTTVRKRRLKLKKKNFVIFLLCLTSISASIYYGISSLIKALTPKTPLLEKYPKTENMHLDIYEKVKEEIKYFKEENITRYQAYQQKNPTLTLKQIITEVNIGLDSPYYTNTKNSTRLNEATILVNKYNFLTKDYIPDNLENVSSKCSLADKKLTHEAKVAFENMAMAAKNDNLSIIAMSAYRSYTYQENLYNNYAKSDGIEKADTYSGRAGYSEHQTGLAVDVYNGKTTYTDFESTEEFTWMQNNAHKYGFILRFPKDKTKETGYQYESWHYRYVGIDIATYIHENNLSYEEYYTQFIDINNN